MPGILVSIDAFNRRTNSRMTVRAGAARNTATLGADGFVWEPAITVLPRFGMQLMDADITGQLMVGVATVTLNLRNIKRLPAIEQLQFEGAPVRIYCGDGSRLALFEQQFVGRILTGTPDNDTGIVALTMQVDRALVDVPLLPQTYGGGGGADGDVELRGRTKPASFGRPINVPPVLLDAVNAVYQFDAYGNATGLDGVYENLASFGASFGDFASYDALVAAAIPEGRFATCIAQGMFRLGADAKGAITCDPVANAATPGSLAVRWLQNHAGIPAARIDVSDFTSLDADLAALIGRVPPVSHYAAESSSVLELWQRLAASCNAVPLLKLNGKIGMARIPGGDVVLTLTNGGQPTVTAWKNVDAPAPWWRGRLSAARSYYVNGPAEIDYEDDIRDLGDFKAGQTYRLGNVVRWTDGARYIYRNVTPSTVAPPDPAYWALYEDAPDATQIRYPSGATLADKEPATGGATRNRVRGEWVAGTEYLVGDVVLRDGSSYDAIIDHNSTADNGPPGPFWVVHAARGKPGESAYTAILTNESHTLPANAAGEVVSYAGANTGIIVLYGTMDVTSAFTASIPDGGNPQGLSIGGAYPSFSVTGGFDANEPEASVTFRLDGNGPHAGVQIDKVWSLAKSRDGGDGTSPALISILASSQTISVRADGTLIENTGRIFAVEKQNTTEPTVWRVYDGAGVQHREFTGETYGTDAQDLLQIINQPAARGEPNTRYCVVRATAGSVSDQISVYAVADGAKGADGASALSAYLTNETFNHPTDSAGNPTAIAGGVGDGQMRVFYGAMDVTSQCTFTAQLPANLQLTVDASGYYQSQALYADTGYALIVAVYQGQSLVKRVSGARSKGGANGAAAPVITLASTEQAFVVDSDGAYKEKTARLTAIPQNSGNAVSWALLNEAGLFIIDWRDAGAFVAAGGASRALDALNIELDEDRFAALLTDHGGNSVTYIARIDGTLTRDSVSINRVKDGERGAAGTSPFLLDLGTSSIIVGATYNGVTKPGQLPRSVSVTVKQGTTDAIGLVNIGVSTSPGVAATYANGQLSISQIDNDGYVEVSASQNGAQVAAAKRISVSRTLDPAPPSSATGQTVKGYQGDPASTSYITPGGNIATVQVPASGQMRITVYAEYTVNANYATARQNYQAAFKVMYRPAGSGGVFSDWAPEAPGTIASWERTTEDYMFGELNYDQTVAMTAGATFEFCLMARKFSGNTSAAYIDATMVVGATS